MNKRIIILTLMLFAAIVSTKAQSLYIYFTDETVNEYPLSQVKKITFSADQMVLTKTDLTSFSWLISDIKKYIYDTSSGITDIKKDLDNLDILIYPNPSNGNFSIKYNVKEYGDVDVSIVSINGKILENVLSEKKEKGNYSITWKNNSLPSGTYFIKVVNKQNINTKTLIILK